MLRQIFPNLSIPARMAGSRIELTGAHPEAQRRRHDRQPDRHRATSMIHDDDDLREIPASLHSIRVSFDPRHDLTQLVSIFTKITLL